MRVFKIISSILLISLSLSDAKHDHKSSCFQNSFIVHVCNSLFTHLIQQSFTLLLHNFFEKCHQGIISHIAYLIRRVLRLSPVWEHVTVEAVW